MRILPYNFLFVGLLLFTINGCSAQSSSEKVIRPAEPRVSIPAAQDFMSYVPLLKNKNVALVVNASSRTTEGHIVDALLQRGIKVVKIFAPEHGFRGDEDAGAIVSDGVDQKSGLPIISLYGSNKKPSAEQLSDVDVILFDIQDVGVRFYTYISTLHYVMEAGAETNTSIILLDRPNPNGHYVDGPVCEEAFRSFIGMHPVPVVYGMTIGEYAKMINGERWLKDGVTAQLTVVNCVDYAHDVHYSLVVRPSPNLPNDLSIQLYPSLCFFEGTVISVGRGTEKQFQIIGHPGLEKPIYDYSFIPMPNYGSKYPKLEGQECKGINFSSVNIDEIRSLEKIQIKYILQIYKDLPIENFFLENGFFDKLAGTNQFRKQILVGASEEEIRKSWEEGIEQFKLIRSKYLIYD